MVLWRAIYSVYVDLNDTAFSHNTNRPAHESRPTCSVVCRDKKKPWCEPVNPSHACPPYLMHENTNAEYKALSPQS